MQNSYTSYYGNEHLCNYDIASDKASQISCQPSEDNIVIYRRIHSSHNQNYLYYFATVPVFYCKDSKSGMKSSASGEPVRLTR